MVQLVLSVSVLRYGVLDRKTTGLAPFRAAAKAFMSVFLDVLFVDAFVLCLLSNLVLLSGMESDTVMRIMDVLLYIVND